MPVDNVDQLRVMEVDIASKNTSDVMYDTEST